ncbi:tyrosine-protein phosphatase non-receptor type 4 isoform X3 [Dendroctonus ponderosae]|uniref:protein-tyrosine-phosphatase n=1 Tax=Dendroctonus ponderosae TaxID=77166 RepID=A0AAR5PG09_DENPD|nr:tyrosine-protein phosphatase non-receptor type 4 isoform X3 [Dendroctonus ponderosae]
MIESVSKKAFGGSSGTYNVQALELAAARERKLKGLSITVKFLDDTQHTFQVDKKSKGVALLDQVYDHLELVEKDYFGLQFSNNGCYNRSSECILWLDPAKSIKKQIDNFQHPLYFKVKFYVSDPSKLHEEYTRYQFYLQLRNDILSEKLILPPSIAILLASYTAQAELGDYNPDEHNSNYLSNIRLIPNQTEEMERKIAELHKLHKGQLPVDAEFTFLDHVKRMDMYGVDLHVAKDSTNKTIQLGVTHIGIVVFHNDIKFNTFSWSKIMKISFKRKQFFIQLRREPSEDYDTLLGFNMEYYRSSKTLWKSCVEHHTFFRLDSPKVRRKFLSLGSKFSYSGRTEFQTMSDVKRKGILERKFVRSPSKQLIKDKSGSVPPPPLEDKGKVSLAPPRPSRPHDTHKVTTSCSNKPKQAWAEDVRISDETLEGPFSPGIAGRVMSYADEEISSPASNGLYDTPPYSTSHSPISQIIDEHVATVILYPDEDGKYGFNVTGGTEISVPILVSKVAPNTSADKCMPRLSEGDQILQINGHDVTNVLQPDVILLVQEARAINSGKLVLTVRPNVLYQDEEYEEPPYQYVPANDVGAPLVGNLLEQSMLFLADGLASGALVTRYETLYRKHPDLSCNEASKPANVNKNRYRDISPYDQTRVVLQNSCGDYINANFVDMKIPGTNMVNRYIATQGPLQTTTEDFWQMVLEQKSTLIVMLTTLVEKGRAKCHKYWPSVGEVLTMCNAIIKCTNEQNDDSNSFVFRDFILIDVKNDSTPREIKHMQYIAWPDHGVPDSPQQFLRFTQHIRGHHKDEKPVVVHCSAGIGRTGVLVLMETALCLMDVVEPIYPLEIVKSMREQRAMMIQNASQYRFVCESVYAAYTEKRASEECCDGKHQSSTDKDI